MSGFCGWIGNADRGLPAEETIARMTARLPAYGPVRAETSAARSGALAMSASPAAGSWYQKSTLSAVIEGYPRWTDPELASLAGRDGHAAALLHGFQEYGEKLLPKIHGDFALAVIDVAAQRGLFAIDRSGIGALCVSESAPGALVFGTTTDSVRAFPGMDTPVGPQTIFDYLFFVDRIPAPKTAFEGLTKLVPGEYLSFEKGKVRRDTYWRLPAEQDHQRSIDDFSSDLFDRMRASIARNVANEPADAVGAFLSGGLDSSTVLGLLAEATANPPKSFTIGFDVDAFDETEFARIAVKHFGAQQHEYSVTPEDVYDAIPKIAAIYDEPFANASAVPVYFCAKLAKENGVDVMLAGDGGDELFAGNSRYVDDRVFDHYGRVPAILRRFLIEPFIAAFATGDSIPLLRKARNYTAIANMSIPGRITRTNVYTSMPPADVFDQAALDRIDVDGPLKFLESVYESTQSESTLRRTLNLDLRLTLADSDLRKVNRMCEMAGVRVHYPFLDDDLLEFSARIPDEVLIRNNELRYFYKRAMQNFLPREILLKKKHGFGLPLIDFTRRHKPLQDLVYDSLTGLKQRDLFKTDFLESAIKHHRNNDAVPVTNVVWDLMMLELWYQTHMDRPETVQVPSPLPRAAAR